MPRVSRSKIAQYFAGEIAERKREPLKRLAAYLIDEGRVRELDLIVKDIERELMGHGIVIADVTSARKLTSDERTGIKQLIGAHSEVYLREVVDEKVIGGVQVRLPGRELNATIARKLQLLRHSKEGF